MKKRYIYLYLIGWWLFCVACTGNFRDYNTDLSGITNEDLNIDDNGYGIRLGLSNKAFILIMITERGRIGLSS